MTETAPLPPTLMASHAAALRRLAQRLVQDPHDAEDALQETWLRALQSPPRTAERVRGWLETVLRNVVRRRARQRARTASREQGAARGEAVAATVDVVVQRQTLRALTDAVLALRPGWQELVFARYFEGLPPREIARRQGLPVAAVHRDLERARAALRRDLSGRLGGRGGWRGSLAALCGLPLPRPAALAPSGLWAGGMLMVVKKQLVVGLVAASAVVLVLVADPGAPAGETPLPPSEARPPAPLAAAGPAEGAAEAPARSAVPAAPPPAEALAPHRFALEIHTRGEDDLPVPGATIWIGPAHHELNRATAGDDGVLRLAWRARVPAMTVVFGSPDEPSGGARLRRCAVRAGETAVVGLRLNSPSRGHRFVLSFVDSRFRSLGAAALSAPPALEVDDEGTAWFVTRGAPSQGTREAPQVAVELAALHSISGRLTLIDGTGGLRLALDQSREAAAAATGVVRGVVRDAAGQPAGNVLVQVGPEPDQRARWSARTEADGSFRIEQVPAGSMHLRAGGGDHGLARAAVKVLADQEVVWHGSLDRGLELTGRLLDARGAPLAGWHVEAVPQNGAEPWIDGAVTGADGRFAIPNVALRAYTLRVRPEGAAVFGRRLDGVWPGGDQALTVRGAELGEGALHAQPVGPDGQPREAVELRLWLDAADEGLRSASSSGDPRELQHLCPGLYTVTAGGPGRAHRDVAQLYVAAGAPTEVGALAVAEPARLGLPKGLDVGERTFPLLRLHDAVPSRAGALSTAERELFLPPGRYVVQDGDAEHAIEVAPGANVFEPRPPAGAGADASTETAK